MKFVQRVQTEDGVIHESQEKAGRHLEERFGEIITPLARDLANIEKYSQALTYIETHLPLFVRLHELRLDMIMEKCGDVDRED